MKPLISIQLREARHVYWPGDDLECRYQIDAIEPTDIQAVEASVLWYSEGKGEEDLAVHAFQRHTPADVPEGDLRRWNTLLCRLPNSPLTYHGVILKIRWCVRVRVFWARGKESTAELHFQLGDVPEPRRPDDEDPSGEGGGRPTLAIADMTAATHGRAQGAGDDE